MYGPSSPYPTNLYLVYRDHLGTKLYTHEMMGIYDDIGPERFRNLCMEAKEIRRLHAAQPAYREMTREWREYQNDLCRWEQAGGNMTNLYRRVQR